MSSISVRDNTNNKIYRTFDPDAHNEYIRSLYERKILTSTRYTLTGEIDAAFTLKPLRKDLERI